MAAGRRLLVCTASPVRSFRWANTLIDRCIGYLAKSWSPHQARPEQHRIRRRKNSDPLRQFDGRVPKVVVISRGMRHCPPIVIGGRRGVAAKKKWDFGALSAALVGNGQRLLAKLTCLLATTPPSRIALKPI